MCVVCFTGYAIRIKGSAAAVHLVIPDQQGYSAVTITHKGMCYSIFPSSNSLTSLKTKSHVYEACNELFIYSETVNSGMRLNTTHDAV